MIKRGYDLVHTGRTDVPESAGKSKYISLYYACINCHNTVVEDPDLTTSDPQVRLEFVEHNNLAFLQGTTFYGTVNREAWYSDDYYKKYGDLVKPANNNIREAIQLCAKECSKGRYLEQWEEDAILAYYYSISYRLKDIFTVSEINDLNIRSVNNNEHDELMSWIKSKYALKSPATFVEPPYETDQMQMPQGNAENGKLIFELSCQACHKPYGSSDVVFDDSKYTFNQFEKWFEKDYWWLYKIVRHGISGYAGHEPYMPLYTAEKMSDQQVEDLKAYFMHEARL
jgi:mono/diheme cytochrome c family protein